MGHEIAGFLQTVALTLAAMLPIINPLGSAPVFLSMTPGASDETRGTLARRVALNSALLMLVAALGGSYVLMFFGLSIAAIKIAGGLLVISAGWRLLSADEPDTKIVTRQLVWDPSQIARIGFFPLTFPLTIGPGSVSVAITLGTGNRSVRQITATLGVATGVAIASFSIYLAYRYAGRLIYALGDTGSVVFLRMSAFILLSVGVQIFTDGLGQRFMIFR